MEIKLGNWTEQRKQNKKMKELSDIFANLEITDEMMDDEMIADLDDIEIEACCETCKIRIAYYEEEDLINGQLFCDKCEKERRIRQ